MLSEYKLAFYTRHVLLSFAWYSSRSEMPEKYIKNNVKNFSSLNVVIFSPVFCNNKTNRVITHSSLSLLTSSQVKHWFSQNYVNFISFQTTSISYFSIFFFRVCDNIWKA
jgi:hypothetical protein